MLNRIIIIGLILCILGSCKQDAQPFKYRIAIVGNPSCVDVRYDDAQMSALKDLGFNTIQINIAWGTHPGDEPLNLEDILYLPGYGNEEEINNRLEETKRRARIAKQWGFRTLFHFGAPRIYPSFKTMLGTPRLDVATETYDIQKREVVDKYIGLLKRLKKEIPELDDIQLYTFDQEAWISSEFGESPSARGVPIYERIIPFLKALTEAWAKVSPEGRLWWEPWGFCAGQIYVCIPQLPTKNFGLFLHSNFAEVQLSRPVDVWFRNVSVLAAERNIPVVGEIFMSGANEETQPLQMVSTPRLVGEQIDAMYRLKLVSGIKEYFGMLPDRYDPNLLMAGLKIKYPSMSNVDALQQLSAPFGKDASLIMHAWELSSQGLALFPWDATWFFRFLTQNWSGVHIFHGWEIAHIYGRVVPKESGITNKSAHFMLSDDEIPDPWLLEDIELRCKASADKLVEAIDYYERIDLSVLDKKYTDYITEAISDFRRMEQMITAIRCYCRLSNLAFMMRKHTSIGEKIPENLILRFEEIMAVDIANQNKNLVKNSGQPTAQEMLELFRKNPEKWADEHLLFR